MGWFVSLFSRGGIRITRAYLRVPKSPKNHTPSLVNGFGYDSVNDECKVFRILENGEKFEAEVFTLGSNSWRLIENLPNVFFFPSLVLRKLYNVFMNDSLHWLTQKNNDFKIVVFNVGREVVNVFQIPRESKDAIRGFGVLGERLCVIGGSDFHSDDLIVWVMKEYGVESSWAKECVINRRAVDSRWFGGLEVMQAKNGELILLGEGRNLGYYDIQKKLFTPIEINPGKADPIRQVQQPILPVGSLFSPENVGRR
ncbi:hypothetical protein IFM89_034386 [Coptis chinensis]|uniref:F-box associated beta-propeller type 1 domain-containing protein n=1 Tax=Coptis chinensis TaxID=261450 RepID=A0A835ME76_9MAGN|nr:hypothetical protein IFM89_034386 [Coptis chinensis]